MTALPVPSALMVGLTLLYLHLFANLNCVMVGLVYLMISVFLFRNSLIVIMLPCRLLMAILVVVVLIVIVDLIT